MTSGKDHASPVIFLCHRHRHHARRLYVPYLSSLSLQQKDQCKLLKDFIPVLQPLSLPLPLLLSSFTQFRFHNAPLQELSTDANLPADDPVAAVKQRIKGLFNRRSRSKQPPQAEGESNSAPAASASTSKPAPPAPDSQPGSFPFAARPFSSMLLTNLSLVPLFLKISN